MNVINPERPRGLPELPLRGCQFHHIEGSATSFQSFRQAELADCDSILLGPSTCTTCVHVYACVHTTSLRWVDACLEGQCGHTTAFSLPAKPTKGACHILKLCDMPDWAEAEGGKPCSERQGVVCMPGCVRVHNSALCQNHLCAQPDCLQMDCSALHGQNDSPILGRCE